MVVGEYASCLKPRLAHNEPKVAKFLQGKSLDRIERKFQPAQTGANHPQVMQNVDCSSGRFMAPKSLMMGWLGLVRKSPYIFPRAK